jgi:hypothetical protein
MYYTHGRTQARGAACGPTHRPKPLLCPSSMVTSSLPLFRLEHCSARSYPSALEAAKCMGDSLHKTRWMRSTSWGRRTSSSPNITRQVYAALEAAKCMGDSLHKTRWMRSTSWGRRTSSSPDITRQVFDRQHAAQALHMDWIGWTPTLDACAGADDVYPHVWTSQH